MKRCPQCAAEYENHVEFCFVDGSALPTDSVEANPRSTSSAPPVVLPPQPRASRSMVPYMLLLLFVSVFLPLGGASAAWLMLRDPAPATAPATQAPAPPTPTLPPPAPVPAPSKSIGIGFTSTPQGAEVWENETLLGVTPCNVEHPDYAALPRTFVLKKAGHPDATLQLTDPTVPQHVELLVQARPRAPLQPPPAVRPKPALETER